MYITDSSRVEDDVIVDLTLISRRLLCFFKSSFSLHAIFIILQSLIFRNQLQKIFGLLRSICLPCLLKRGLDCSRYLSIELVFLVVLIVSLLWSFLFAFLIFLTKKFGEEALFLCWSTDYLEFFLFYR